MKKIFYILTALFIISSCEKEHTEIMDMTLDAKYITKIELRADHNSLIPNGKAKMQFYTFVYAEKEVIAYNDKGLKDTILTEYLVPNSQLPAGSIKIYAPNGEELKDNIYSTTNSTLAGNTLEFKATYRDIESNKLPIKIREIPAENYSEIVVPVIFHMMLPPATSSITYDISSEYLQSVLDRMNNIFNNKQTTDPNGGNAKITFKLALYRPNGLLLAEAGKNIINLTEAQITAIGTGTGNLSTGYDNHIVANKSTCIWDPNKYLNIWLTKLRSSSSTTGSGSGFSYTASAPKIIASKYPVTEIPGLTGLTQKDSFGLSDIVTGTSCLEAGILVNYMSFLNPQSQNVINQFSMAVPLGIYYGLIINTSPSSTSYPAADPDFCDDTITHYFDIASNRTVFKSNASYTSANKPARQYFTSFNCMEVFTRGSSITVDQASRLRNVIEKCPSRWSYKSDFAFTGK